MPDDIQSSKYQTRARQPLNKQPLTAQQLFNKICNRIVKANYFEEFVYYGIKPEIGITVTRLLGNEPRVERAQSRSVLSGSRHFRSIAD